MNETNQRVALVTGAAGALGRALVEALMARGIDAVGLDRDRRGLERLHDRMATAGGAPLVVPLDLAGAGPQHFDELADDLGRRFGRLDLLIHAAAEFRALTPIEHHDPEDWMKVLQAGLTGPYLLTRALLPLLRATPASRMLWIVDDPDIRRCAYRGAYGVSQSGRSTLAAILAAECEKTGPNVAVFDPGPFHSPLRARAWPVENPLDLPSAESAARGVLDALGLE